MKPTDSTTKDSLPLGGEGWASVESLIQDDKNFNRGTEEGQRLMNQSLERFGAGRSILIDQNNRIIAGNKTAKTYEALGRKKVRIIETTGDELIAVKRTDIDLDSPEGRELALADNATAKANLEWDEEVLQEVGISFEDWGVSFDGVDKEQIEKQEKKEKKEIKRLKDQYIMPPMSILDTRSGLWQQRRNFWLDKTGIKSEFGRDENLCYAITAQGAEFYEMKNDLRAQLGREPTTEELIAKYTEAGLYMFGGTSIFDPVLCELMYRWYNTEGGSILDPFAGGSVRGVIAGYLRMPYTGNDLREEQVNENRIQGMAAFSDEWTGPKPIWTAGDSCEIDAILKSIGHGEEKYDMIFSCPPYADLEVYSDDPRDISNMSYDDFITAYRTIIRKSCEKLKNNRFAVFVVSEVRGKNGRYYNFVGDTVKAFEDCGLMYYNELILVNQIGSKSITAHKAFSQSRKIGRHHQNILVFAKGNPQEVNDLYEDIHLKKAIAMYNDQRIMSDRHNKILVFYKGLNPKDVSLDFKTETPPDPDWETIAQFTQQEIKDDE